MNTTISDILELLIKDSIDLYEIWDTNRNNITDTFESDYDLINDYDCDNMEIESFEFRNENGKNILTFNI